MKLTNIALALALVAPVSVNAASNFVAGQSDTRVRTVQYADNLVVSFVGFQGSPTVIEFGKNETIDDVAGGAIIGWDTGKVGNRIFLVPLDTAKAGTVIVATNKHSYVLDVAPAYKGTSRAQRVSKIVYEYDSVKAAQRSDTLNSSYVRPANMNYSMELVNTSVEIRPYKVFDDGTFTYFYFPKNTQLPAIYKASPGTQDEWLTNHHVAEDGAVVVHSISAQWNLRLDKAVIGVFNDSFSPSGDLQGSL